MIEISEIKLKGRRIGKDGWFPGLRVLLNTSIKAKLGDDDGLFVGYGKINDLLPYKMQDNYDAAPEMLTFKTVVLENQFLKAVFLPEVGGKLWSLYDKVAQKDVILQNSEFLPCNLAIRNAWLAGGVEFNCGRQGHDEQTCSPRFAAIVKNGKYEALRIYEFQRDRGVIFQYDCFLPEDSRFLFIRGRIYNPNDYLVPMYWWSNIAVPELPGTRVVVPAVEAFANMYDSGTHALSKVKLPDGEGFDATYPVNFPYIKDHFYNIPEGVRPFECMFYPDGLGFCHCSTRRLRGRKLFVWGQSKGGRHWNKKLLGEGLDAYIELQAGLGRSQQECLPMPPKTAWEWMEAYGHVRTDAANVFGEWDKAVETVSSVVEEAVPRAFMDELLSDTKALALSPGEVICSGSGWGALEELRIGHSLASHLDFGKPGEEQKQWMELLNTGTIAECKPNSYLVSDEWFDLLKAAKPSWQVHYHLALNYFRRDDFERAEQHLALAAIEGDKEYVLHAMANIRARQERYDEAASYIKQAAMLKLDDASFVKESLKMLMSMEHYQEMADIVANLPQNVAERPLLRMLKAAALAHTGQVYLAEKILLENGGYDIPDIREGENSSSQLYLYIKEQQAIQEGREFDASKCQVPLILDLRMRRPIPVK